MSQGFEGHNPYRPTDLSTGTGAPPGLGVPPPPAYLDTPTKVIAILFAIFGGLGVFGLLSSVMFMVMFMVVANMNVDPTSEFGKFIDQMKMNLPVGVIVLNIVGGLASVLMMVGGIGALRRRLWGASLVRNVAGFYAFYKIVEVVGGAYFQYQGLQANIEKMKADNNLPPGMDIETVMTASFFVGIAIAVVIAILLVAFYAWVFLHMSKPSTREQFS